MRNKEAALFRFDVEEHRLFVKDGKRLFGKEYYVRNPQWCCTAMSEQAAPEGLSVPTPFSRNGVVRAVGIPVDSQWHVLTANHCPWCGAPIEGRLTKTKKVRHSQL